MGCFLYYGEEYQYLQDNRSQGTGMSADRCAAMARAAEPSARVFSVSGSER
jgi:hypothetical protein